MLQHLLGVEICNEEGNIIALYRLPSQYEEAFRSLRQESGELVHEYVLNLIRLLDFDGYSDGVHRRFDEDAFVLVPRNG